MLSSANVYGRAPDNSNFLPEETPLMAGERFSEMRDLVELDMYAQSFVWKHPELETVILRPVNIVGPTVRNASNFLRIERPLTVMGFDPMLQIIHEQDVCRALALAWKAGPARHLQRDGSGAAPALRHPARARTPPHPRAAPPHPVAPAPRVRGTAHELRRRRSIRIQYLCIVDRSRFVREAGSEASLRETIRSVAPSREALGVPCARPRSCSSRRARGAPLSPRSLRSSRRADPFPRLRRPGQRASFDETRIV